KDFADAAGFARDAGFVGFECHTSIWSCIDLILPDCINRRQDDYGGNIENRSLFLIDVVDAYSGVWCACSNGVHLSPYGTYHDIHDSVPDSLFCHVAQELGQRGVGFIFIREARGKEALTARMRSLFGGSVIVNQEYTLERAQQALDEQRADAVAFGRAFISNPVLVRRLKTGAELREWDPSTFYSEGPQGYVDYPCACTDTPVLNEA